MGMPKERERRFTYADYLKWPDEERWEVFEVEGPKAVERPEEPSL